MKKSNNLKKNIDEIKSAFKGLKSRADIAEILEITDKKLCYFLYKLNPEQRFHQFSIPKKNGEMREIFAPKDKFKLIQRNLAHILYCNYIPKMCSHGFERAYLNSKNECISKNIMSNAQTHVNKKYILNIDLKDFFPSINFGRVRGLFKGHPYCFCDEVATVLAQICCYKDFLPQGSPTSPIISNMICRSLDNEILKFIKPLKCSYTRYADDLTFSTNLNKFPEEIFAQEELSKVLIDKIEASGFKINNGKTRLADRKTRQIVTGLVVNKKTNINRVYVRNIRALLHQWEKDGEEATQKKFHDKFFHNSTQKPKLRNVLIGRICFVKQVRGEQDAIFIKLWNKYNLLIGKNEKLKQLVTDDESILGLISEGESYKLEFKQSLEYSQDQDKCIGALTYLNAKNKTKESPKFKILKSIASFLNSEEGGTLLVGVIDSGLIRGLKEDLDNCGKGSVDELGQKVSNWVADYFKPLPIDKIMTKFYKNKDKLILKIDIKPYPEPVYFLNGDKEHLFVKHDVRTYEIKTKHEITQWIRANNKMVISAKK